MKVLKAITIFPVAILLLFALFGGYGLAKLTAKQMDKKKKTVRQQ